jgi:hypothetical protein
MPRLKLQFQSAGIGGWFSTPDSAGPFRGNSPGFNAPTPKAPLPKTLAVNEDRQVSGTFEVIVSVEGQAVVETTLYASSRGTASKARAVLNQWRLNPASLDGKPIRVRLRVQVFGN